MYKKSYQLPWKLSEVYSNQKCAQLKCQKQKHYQRHKGGYGSYN